MDAIPASIPFHLSKAYATPMSQVGAARAGTLSAAGKAATSPAAMPIDTFTANSTAVDRANLAARAKKPAMASLIAAKVNASPIDELEANATQSTHQPRVASPASQTDSFEPSSGRGETLAAAARSSQAPFQLYRHPAAQNAAATGVDAGRQLDAMG